jgi:hypothetical protein
MFSRHSVTKILLKGAVIQTDVELTPDWLTPLVANDQRGGPLPFWRFVRQASRDNDVQHA